MKKAVLYLILLVCVSCGSIQPQEGEAFFDVFTYRGEDDFYALNPLPGKDYYYNPILPGWYSDPSICTNGEGDYFLVTSTFCYVNGVPLFHSRDLVNWTQIGNVLDRPSQLLHFEGHNISRGIFAPAISYNPQNKTYYMVTTNVCDATFYVKTQDPYGPWSDPIVLPSVHGIDPSFFFDEDGKAYLVNNDAAPNNAPEYEGHRTLRIREFDVYNDCVVGEERIIVDKGANPQEQPVWIEGPHLYKVDGRYLLMAAEGGTESNHSEVIFSSNSPWGPFVPWSGNPILTQRHLDPNRPNPIACAGHADLIQTVEGDWWAVFLACRPNKGQFENLGRETFLMPAKWSKDGFPYITTGSEQVPLIAKRPGVVRGDNPTFGNFEFTASLTDSVLSPSWMQLYVPGQVKSLALYCSPNDAGKMGPTQYLAHRMQHHQFTCTTRMRFNPVEEGQQAGLLLFKDETHYYFFSVGIIQGVRCITLQQKNAYGTRIIARYNTKHKAAIDLRVVSRGASYDFYFATKNDKWQTLCRNIDASFLSTSFAGGFTGTTIGPYAVQFTDYLDK